MSFYWWEKCNALISFIKVGTQKGKDTRNRMMDQKDDEKHSCFMWIIREIGWNYNSCLFFYPKEYCNVMFLEWGLIKKNFYAKWAPCKDIYWVEISILPEWKQNMNGGLHLP